MNKDVICKFCKKRFLVKSWRNAKFCSRQCSANFNKNRKQKTCLNCGTSFEVMGYLKTIFCSRKCSSEHAQKTGRTKYSEDKKAKVTKVCEFCKKEFKVWNYRKNARYCSKKCHYKAGQKILQCTKCGTFHEEQINEINKNLNIELFCTNCRNLNSTSAFEIHIKNCLIDIFGPDRIKSNQRIEYDKGKYIYPDIVANSNVVIECNGDFFHCNPEYFSAEYYNPKLQKFAKDIWERDKFKLDIYNRYHYNIIIIWESEWKDKREDVLIRIKNEIYKNQNNKKS